MKVVVVNSRCGNGSTGRICVGIANALNANGHKAYIAYGIGDSSEVNSIKISNDIETFVHKVFSKLFDCEGLCSFFSTYKLIRYLKRINPDVVNIHTIHGSYLNYPLLFTYLKKANCKVVWTLHDCWSFTGHCAHFYECNRWKSQCGDCPYKRDYPESLFFDCSKKNHIRKKKLFCQLGNKLTIVPVSHWLERYVKESFLKGMKINVIHNGIDTDRFNIVESPNFIREQHLSGRTIILGVALPWSKYKGLDDFFKMRERLSDRFIIVLVGLDDKQKDSMLPGMLGLGRTESIEKLVDIYNSADVFVNPTYQDTFPTVNIEAMSCGTPVITYNTGGSPESVNKDTGQVVPQGNIDALCGAINAIAINHKSKDTKSKCRNNVLNNYNSISQFYKYVELFNSIIQE